MKSNKPQPTTRTTKKARLEKGKASLDAMLETLRPFLPRVDLSQPEPARRWQLTNARCSLPAAQPPTAPDALWL